MVQFPSSLSAPSPRWIVMLSLGIAIWIGIGFQRDDLYNSPGGRMSISLWHRFPGTPVDEKEALIDWTGHGTRRRTSSLLLHSRPSRLTLGTSHIGSAVWTSSYPSPSTVGPFPKRQWIKRLQFIRKQAASSRKQGLLNDLSVSPASLKKDGYVVYPEGIQLGGGPMAACSWESTGCLRNSRNGYHEDLDIVDSDNRTWVINFDDGPLPPSKSLYKVLDEFNVKATHFWIGGNVLKYWNLALIADQRGDHLAVHTWSHSHLTCLSDHQVLGELGWSIQIISDLTGKIPKYFRPPYGNIDNRIRAIAKHVFGLETVIWNFDSVDWGLNQTYATGDQVDAPDPKTAPTVSEVIKKIENFAIQRRSDRLPGSLILEHELSEESVEAFKQSWNVVQQQNFAQVGPLPDCLNEGKADWYQHEQTDS